MNQKKITKIKNSNKFVFILFISVALNKLLLLKYVAVLIKKLFYKLKAKDKVKILINYEKCINIKN
tara:strand:+ start:49 stop:246 length:198 start_codon:yes stop_codon:yes gene_type:complete